MRYISVKRYGNGCAIVRNLTNKELFINILGRTVTMDPKGWCGLSSDAEGRAYIKSFEKGEYTITAKEVTR